MASLAYDQQSGQLGPVRRHALVSGVRRPTPGSGTAQQTLGPADAGDQPSGPADASMAYDPSMGSGELVLFGGLNINTIPMNDTWAWNGSTWAQQSPALSPSPRQDTSLAYDSGTGQMLLYGGFYNGLTCPGSSSDWCNDTWSWTGSTWGLLAPTVNPGARTLAGLAYDAAANQMVMYGGNYNATDQTDTWLIGPPSVSSSQPRLRAGRRRHLGLHHRHRLHRRHRGQLRLRSRSRRPTTPSTRPLRSRPARRPEPAGTTVDVTVTGTATGTAVAKPGHLGRPVHLRPELIVVPGLARRPPLGPPKLGGGVRPRHQPDGPVQRQRLRDGHLGLERLGLDRGGHRRPAGPDRLVHGLRRGHQPAHPFRRFQRERRLPTRGPGPAPPGPSSTPAPAARHQPWAMAMAYYPATGQMVLFGGLGGSHLNDTWAWNSFDLERGRSFPATSPLARSAAVMAYDPATSQLVLFGGGNTTSPYSDTWTWNGTTWDQLYPSVSPPGRNFATLAYDPTSSQLLLSGGCSTLTLTTACVMSDTWAWDGSWSQLSPATAPSARAGPAPWPLTPTTTRWSCSAGRRRPAMWRTPG